jgi:hypothetical protein
MTGSNNAPAAVNADTDLHQPRKELPLSMRDFFDDLPRPGLSQAISLPVLVNINNKRREE